MTSNPIRPILDVRRGNIEVRALTPQDLAESLLPTEIERESKSSVNLRLCIVASRRPSSSSE